MSKVNVLIRKGRDGFELNYGPLVVGEVEGIQVIAEDWRFDQLGISYTVPEADPVTDVVPEVPEFNLDIKLVMRIGNNQIYFHVLKKEDIKPLACALSKYTVAERVDVTMAARILQIWKKGECGEQRDLSHFYSDLTEAEIEASKF